MTRWNWVEPSFFALLFSLIFAFVARKRRGRFWFLVVVEKTTNNNNNERGNCIYVYIVCTIIHIHLLFSVCSDAAIEVNSLCFLFPFPFVLVKRARRGILLRYGRFRDRLVSVSRERVKKSRRASG